MRTAFLGTPAAAIPSLAALADLADVEVVITRPDRPRGRSGRPAPPPLKTAAEQWGFRVEQPETGEGLLDVLASHELDVALVVAYGRILTPEMLATTRTGFVNVHFSLLPRWRGAAPVEWSIYEGDTRSGVSLMVIDHGLDTGPVISAAEAEIDPTDTSGSLTACLAYIGADLVNEMLLPYVEGHLQPAPQLAAGVTQAPALDRDIARIEPAWQVDRAERAVRAFHPRPGAWVEFEDRPLKIMKAEITSMPVLQGRVEPADGGVALGLDGGSLQLLEVQSPGRRIQSGREWLNGRRGVGGEIAARIR